MEGGVVNEVDAPEGSGCWCPVDAVVVCLGLVPKVERVGEECGVLDGVEVLEPVSVGDAGACGSARGATGGAVFAAGSVLPVTIGSKGCSLGTEVQLY
jgi:hypothetical protein